MTEPGPTGEESTQQNAQQNDANAGQQPSLVGYMMNNKVEAGLWLTRVCTVVSSLLFFLPLFGGHPYSHYQRALISNAATSALRLHQRLPNFQFSRVFMGLLFAEDSCHYLFYSIIFLNCNPVTMVLIPIFLFGLLHACTYSKNLLNLLGTNSLMFLRNLLDKLQAQQISILRFIACSEIFLMPAMAFMVFSGKCTIFHPFIYYRFLSLRYSSRRNPYCRTLFYEMRLTVEHLYNKPQCPAFVRNALIKGVAVISRLAPQTVAQ